MSHQNNVLDAPTIAIEKILRQRIKVILETRLPKSVIEMMKFSIHKSPSIEGIESDLVHRLTTYLSGNEHKSKHYVNRIVYEHPATWWDMLKATYFPRNMYGRGLLKWLPIKYTKISRLAEIHYTRIFIYPDEEINTNPEHTHFEKLVLRYDKQQENN
jgi:hypothetical protein